MSDAGKYSEGKYCRSPFADQDLGQPIPRCDGGLPGVERLTTLPEDAQRVSRDARRELASDPQRFVDEYRKQFGNSFGADDAAELFSGYNASEKTRAKFHTAIHAAARWVRDEAFRQALADPSSPGRVIFTSGGSASGKSTVVPALLNKGSALVYDSTLSDLAGSKRSIEASLAAGKDVTIVHFRRPIEDAFAASLYRATSGSGGGRTTNITSI
jgi:hypothetical protein